MIITLRTFPAVTAALAVAGGAYAIDAGGIAIHGSLSATGAYSDQYNYYGDTAEHFDVITKEITLNGTYRFESGLRAAAQIYAYELADYSALTLDFATLDYSFSELVGLRVGRNKLPQGLYGEVQDLDQVRTFASLPLNFYPRALRSLSAGYNGAGVYGTIPLHKAGSLEYQGIFGWMDNIDGDTPFARGLAGISDVDQANLDKVMGGALIWNAPLEGLKLGYTYNFLPDIVSSGSLQTRAGMAAVGYPGTEAAGIDFLYGAGAWDYSGLFAGTPNVSTVDATVQVFSAEYTHDKWVAAAEYKKMKNDGVTNLPAFGIKNKPVTTEEEHWYGQVTYQALEKLGVGVYYAHSDFDPSDTNPLSDDFTTVKDFAAAVSYALAPNWLIKVEGHALDGLGKLNIAGDVNVPATDTTWNYFLVKATFSF